MKLKGINLKDFPNINDYEVFPDSQGRISSCYIDTELINTPHDLNEWLRFTKALSKAETKELKCVCYKVHGGIGYCGERDMDCIREKGLIELTLSLPYNKKMIVYGCDGRK